MKNRDDWSGRSAYERERRRLELVLWILVFGSFAIAAAVVLFAPRLQ